MNWQQALSDSFTSPEALLAHLDLDPQLGSRVAESLFPFRVTRCYADRMTRGDASDPLLRQVLPLRDEHDAGIQRYATEDPVGDLLAVRGGGILHKYQGRVLVLATGSCAIHCRYCFRRNFAYAEHQFSRSAMAGNLRFLDEHPETEEVILSGGDPLTLSDQRLSELLQALDRRPQIRRLRIHSRFPMILPERITPELLSLLTSLRVPLTWVLHANHPQEIDAATLEALQCLRRSGVQLLNQSVLLKGVNDHPDVLASLSRILFDEGGVLPYYLHQLDQVRGGMHFLVDDDAALAIHAELQRQLPGYLVPRLVREIAGQPCKTPLADVSTFG